MGPDDGGPEYGWVQVCRDDATIGWDSCNVSSELYRT